MTTQHAGDDGRLYIGVDLSGTTVKAGLVDGAGRVAHELSAQIESERAEDLFRQLVAFVRELQSNSRAEGNVAAVGVGLPGLVDNANHRAVVLPNLPDLSSLDVYGELRDLTGLPVVLDNDANAAAYGELIAGAGRGSSNLFYVHIGTGVGSGLVLRL